MKRMKTNSLSNVRGLGGLLLCIGALFVVLSLTLSLAAQNSPKVLNAPLQFPELPLPRSTKSMVRQGQAPNKNPTQRENDTAAVNAADLGLGRPLGVTLPEVLQLAVLANLDIQQARLVVERARVAQQRARIAFLPDVSLGSTYVDHDGQIQRVEGTILPVNRNSLFVGGGPSLRVDLGTALFVPREARWLLDATMHNQRRVTNEALGAVAEAYVAVLRARRRLGRLDETLEFLTSQRESELRGGSKGLLPLIQAFVKQDSALPSDLARVEVDVLRRREERESALQEMRQASAELARLLHLDATWFLVPREDFRYPLLVPADLWINRPLEELVSLALHNRPELAENQAAVAAALTRLRSAQYGPLLPSINVNYSWGGFGGGPEIVDRTRTGGAVLGSSGVIADFDTRSDFDISVVWRLQNLGLGNRAEIRDRRVQHEQVYVRGLWLQDQVVAQVVSAVEGVKRSAERVKIIQEGIMDEKGQRGGAVYRSLRLNFLRIRGGQGQPLDVLDSTRRLSDVLEGYATAVSEYDRWRFRLVLALGMPPQYFLPGPPLSPTSEGAATPEDRSR